MKTSQDCWSVNFFLRRQDQQETPVWTAGEALLKFTSFCESCSLQHGGGFSIPKQGETPANTQELRLRETRNFLAMTELQQLSHINEPASELRPDQASQWLFRLVVEDGGSEDVVEIDRVRHAYALFQDWAVSRGLVVSGVIEPLVLDMDLDDRFFRIIESLAKKNVKGEARHASPKASG
jgi:hypothetical protein